MPSTTDIERKLVGQLLDEPAFNDFTVDEIAEVARTIVPVVETVAQNGHSSAPVTESDYYGLVSYTDANTVAFMEDFTTYVGSEVFVKIGNLSQGKLHGYRSRLFYRAKVNGNGIKTRVYGSLMHVTVV